MNSIGDGVLQGMAQQFAHGVDASGLNKLLPAEVNRIEFIRDALGRPGNARAVGLQLAAQGSVEEKKTLFGDLMQAARSAHGPVGSVREIIAGMPREWVSEQIAGQVDEILRSEEYDDYWMMLELLEQVVPAQAVSVARRAIGHTDADIRELGMLSLAHREAASRGSIERRHS